jgi:hypothetical protein
MSILVLIPKTSGGYRGIGLLEILWKVCSSIITDRLNDGIDFHDALHGFQQGRGTGTASIDAKLHMQLAHIRGTPLYQVFLDLSKAYDTLNRATTLQILKEYGVGPRIILLLTNFWNSLQVVARQQGYHGEPIRTERGTTQGDIISPTIFNVVIDAIVHEWHHRLEAEGLSNTVQAIFYADDGHLYSNDANALQRATNIMTELFETIGLKTNPDKTKSMVCAPKPSITRICSPAYKRRMIDQNEPTYSARKRQRVECDICNATIQAKSSLTRHKRLKHGIDATITTQQNTPPHLAMLTGNTYEVSMPTYKDPTPCPIPGCGVTIQNRYKMREHFLYRHYHDTIIISEEGLLPRCDKCGLFCSESALATTHRDSAACRRNEKRNRKKTLNLQCI